MDKQQAQKIVDGLRAAAAAAGPVVELQGHEARSFMFVAPESIVVGSFSLLNGAFFVLVGNHLRLPRFAPRAGLSASSYKPRNKVVLTTNRSDAQGVTWSYSASLQDGKDAVRKQVFREAAGTDSIVIPYPTADASAFISAITRAIELRALAHAAGGEDADEEEASGEESS